MLAAARGGVEGLKSVAGLKGVGIDARAVGWCKEADRDASRAQAWVPSTRTVEAAGTAGRKRELGR